MKHADSQSHPFDRLAHAMGYCHARSLALGGRDGSEPIDYQSFSSIVDDFCDANGGVGDSFWMGVLLRGNTSPSPYDQNKKPPFWMVHKRIPCSGTNRASEGILGALDANLGAVDR